MDVVGMFLPWMVLLSIMILDYLLVNCNIVPSNLIRLTDPLVHGALGIAIAYSITGKNCGLKEIVLGFLSGTLLDLDHIVVSKGFNWRKLINLGCRPRTHSFIFVTLVSMISVFFVNSPSPIPFILFSGMMNHILKDATVGGTPIFYPFKDMGMPIIPYWLYIQLSLFAPICSHFFLR